MNVDRRPGAVRNIALGLSVAAVCFLAQAAAAQAPVAVGPEGWTPPRVAPGPRIVTGMRHVSDVAAAGELGLLAPEALAVDHRGDILVADTGNHRLLLVTRDGEVLEEFGGFGWEDGQFDTPSDLSVYEGFYTYVLDEGNRRVVRYDADGDFLDVIVPEDDAGTPVAMAIGPAGGLFLVDLDSQSVVSYSQFEERLSPLGRFGLDEGGLADPADVAVGPGREVAVADRGRFSIEVFDEFGSELYSLATPDTMFPVDITFDHVGNVFVADGRHGRILAFPAGGGPPTAYLAGGDDWVPSALAMGRPGELLTLDGETGRLLIIETVYGGESPRER